MKSIVRRMSPLTPSRSRSISDTSSRGDVNTVQASVLFHVSTSMQSDIRTRTLMFRFKAYKHVVRGSEIVDYLVENAVASDTVQAEYYADELVQGGFIYNAHNEEEMFFDTSGVYRFACDKSVAEVVDLNQLKVEFKAYLIAENSDEHMNRTMTRVPFHGMKLVTWLCEKGYASDRNEGVKMGQLLVDGGFVSRNTALLPSNEFTDDSDWFRVEDASLPPTNNRKQFTRNTSMTHLRVSRRQKSSNREIN
uniref:DEP domain-containing protein n=1 Tax=Timspurckia oligopyrenoides TaxID=708627 RepID=A0A7S1ESW5_9RHOD|mmetsp:Transcript_4858/g.8466  ORF Transcript_4858/g.8466 Transcript_4858/m.8466 type:complete len:250 (+) Transcript_4858:129-878(+)